MCLIYSTFFTSQLNQIKISTPKSWLYVDQEYLVLLQQQQQLWRQQQQDRYRLLGLWQLRLDKQDK